MHTHLRVVTLLIPVCFGSAFAQCPDDPCTPDYQTASSWATGVVGGNPNGSNDDVEVVSSSGQFPDAILAHITFSKEPSPGNGCKFHSGGHSAAENNPWNRWAQITLPSCANLGVKVEYELGTFDHWVSGNPLSDVFYLGVGAQAFTATDSLGSVSCSNAPQFSDSLFQGKVYWWGNNTILCEGTCNQNSNLEPCRMSGTQFFDFRQDSSAPLLRLGLRTGYCIWSFGSFDMKILPLTIDILDPFLFYVSNGNVTNDPDGLASFDGLCDGVAADGATQVVLRHEVLGPGHVQFQVDDPYGGPTSTDEVGFFSSLGGQEEQLSLTANVEEVDGRYFAFAVYHAPADFVTAAQHINDPGGCRRVRVRAEFQPEAGEHVAGTTMATRDIRIRRPPVVLIHGLWSDAFTWGGPPQQTFITSPGFTVVTKNYRDTHASWFSVNKEVVKKGVQQATSKMRQQNYAVTRADVVGHSMGGVLARLYAQSRYGVTYLRNDNFNKGDIHKLIPIDSPLKGSVMAFLLMNSAPLLKAVEEAGKDCSSGAVSDLDPWRLPVIANPSWLANSQATDVYAHAIVGTGGATAIANPLAAGEDWGLALIEKIFQLGQHFAGPHDLIVDQFSQVGNVTFSSAFGYVNSAQPGTHGSIHHETRVKLRVLDLLNTNILNNGTWSPTIPARQGNTPVPIVPQLTPVSGLEIVFPPSGTVVSSGSTLPVIVKVKDFEPDRILVISPLDVAEIDPLVLETTLNIPANAVGPMTLYAIALDANSNIAETQVVTVQIVPPANLTGISVDPQSFELTRAGSTEQLRVTGHYDDQVDRDLTNAALGTTYLSSDINVATVSVDGLVTSVGFGTCTITATNGIFNDVAEVEVTGLPCPGDINEDDAVSVPDLLIVINSWGPCYACAADFNGDGVVGVPDMLNVINHWGPCPAPEGFDSLVADPDFTCIDAVKWGAYLEILNSGTAEEIACWNCWVYWQLCVCADLCDDKPPDCGCPDPL